MQQSWHERRPAPRWLLGLAAIAAVVTVVCIFVIDQPVARVIGRHEPLPIWKPVVEVLDTIMLFPIHALALPALLVIAMVVTVSVKRLHAYAPALMFVTGVHLASRLTTGWFKDLTDRIRPDPWLASGRDDTFWRGGDAFPSGHVVLWAGLLLPLIVIAPRWRPLLVVVAVIAAARIGINKHYVSDTVAAVGYIAVWTSVVGWLVRPCRGVVAPTRERGHADTRQ